MDRDEQSRAGGVGHMNGLLGRAVMTNPWVVRANWHQRRIEWTEAAMVPEHRRVGRVAADQQAPALTFDDETRVTAPRIALHPRPQWRTSMAWTCTSPRGVRTRADSFQRSS